MTGVIPLTAQREEINVRTWLGVIKNLAADILLGPIFIERCIEGIFRVKWKIFLIYSSPVAILSTQSLPVEIASLVF